MDKLEYRSVIKFLVLEGTSSCEIQARMLKAYGDLSPSPSTIKKWAAEFKKGRTSIKDDPREGRPKCATGSDIVQKVSVLVLQDKRLKVREIADNIEVSTGSAFEILTKKLKMKKLFGRWLPAVLSDTELANRKKAAENLLTIFNDKNLNLFDNLITLGETWIHVYEQQIKQEATPPKLKKASASSEKILAWIFWDAEGILLSNYIKKDEAVNNQYVICLLEHLNRALREKRPNRLAKLTFFYSDLPETFEHPTVLNKLKEMNYELLKQPEHSSDLSPSDYHLFPKLENFLQAKRPTTVDEAIEASEYYLYDIPQSSPQNFFRFGIEMLEKRCIDCVSLHGNYVEQYSVDKFCAEATEEVLS